MQGITRGQKRGIERFAIERYQRFCRRKEVRQTFEQRGFLRGIAHKQLSENELSINEARRADEECIRASAARETGCLGVQKCERRKRKLLDARIVSPL